MVIIELSLLDVWCSADIDRESERYIWERGSLKEETKLDQKVTILGKKISVCDSVYFVPVSSFVLLVILHSIGATSTIAH